MCVVLLTGTAESVRNPLTVHATSTTQGKIDQTEKDKDKLQDQLEQQQQELS